MDLARYIALYLIPCLRRLGTLLARLDLCLPPHLQTHQPRLYLSTHTHRSAN